MGFAFLINETKKVKQSLSYFCYRIYILLYICAKFVPYDNEYQGPLRFEDGNRDCSLKERGGNITEGYCF